MKTLESAVAFLISLLIAGAVVPAFAAPDWTPEQKEIINVMDQWQKAYDNGDADKLGQLLANEIDFTSRSLKGTFKDRASFLEAYKKWVAENRAKMALISQYITYLEAKVSGGEASVTRKIDWTQKGDRGLSSGTLTKTTQLKKLNGEWKIYAEK